ncbi:MAG TPA: hypothetical protein PKK85_03725 [Methanobacteriaceae archaeon]|nr:hypothetical protein [Methanobacteriaceae archaeon]
MMVERPILRIIVSDKKELLDPKSLEGYQPGDTVALIYGPDLEKLVNDLKELLDDYQELYKKYDEAREVIKKHIEKQGGG